MAGLLDAYSTYAERKCQELKQQNTVLEKLAEKTGYTKIMGGIQDYLSEGILESLKDSPLRALAEDVLSQTINDNARRLAQNILSQTTEKVKQELLVVRATVFNSVFSAITFKNDMILYFASTVAKKTVEEIRGKRRTLIAMKESVRNLHNALLILAGGQPFFSQYLADLRKSLIKVSQASIQIAIVRSAWTESSIFPKPNFSEADTLLQQAYDLVLPPVVGDAEEIKELESGYLKNVLKNPDPSVQLAMLQSIPKLAGEMLGQYDLYAVKVLKVNAQLLGFQNIVVNVKEVSGGKFKDLITKQLDLLVKHLKVIVETMALDLNGEELAIDGPITIKTENITQGNETGVRIYKPNPTKTSSKAIIWGVKIKAAQVLLKIVDPDALQGISMSNKALKQYDDAIKALSKFDDRKSATAVLRATDGRESVGDLEADFISFAFQANQAIVDSSFTKKKDGRFSAKTVLALGAKLSSRLQLSIEQDREVEEELIKFISKSEAIVKNLKALGDSIFSIMSSLGMDRAKDFLEKGSFSEFFDANARNASYIGAAVAGLTFVYGTAGTIEDQACINTVLKKLKSEETAQKLAALRKVSTVFVKQQEKNDKRCEEYEKDRKRISVCSSAIDRSQLHDNPVKSLKGIFSGIFGGKINEGLNGTAELLGDVGISGVGGIASLVGVSAGNTFTRSGANKKGQEEAKANADNKDTKAKKDMVEALKDSGVPASEDESVGDLKEKSERASKKATDVSIQDKLKEAIASGDVAEAAKKELSRLAKAKIKNVFKL